MQVWSDLTNDQQQALLARPALADNKKLSDIVSGVIEQVRSQGDQALTELTKRFDGVRLAKFALSSDALENAAQEISPDVKSAIDLAYGNILAFHKAQKPQSIRVETSTGVVCESMQKAIHSVGLYIPGGSAPLPSTVLMLGIPAQVAGCKRRVLCTPPNTNGEIAAEIRYAATLCGIDEIYLIGGAQAIAAMAFGTPSIRKVDKIFGPGNSFVTEAKQQVSRVAGGVAIDMPAGPSEVLVVADGNANPAFVAADLLSQAEHGPDSQAVLISNNIQTIEQTKTAVDEQLQTLSRSDIAQKAIQHSRYILTESIGQAIKVSNRYAPEHLIMQVDNPRARLNDIENAGSIFLGQWSPESAGDYASGTNHVLPTYGYARNYSSLGLADFYRRFTVQELSREGLENIGPAIMNLANAEGLDAHRQAVAIRLEQQPSAKEES